MPVVKVEKFGGPEVLQLVDEPDPVAGEGQVSVQVKASGVNYADVMAVAGHYPGVPSAPFYPGLEIAGTVNGIGSGVEGFKLGDRVIGFVGSRGYATSAVIDAKSAVHIPESLEFGAASALLVQGLTAYFLLEHGQNGSGKSVLISSAAGGLGSLAIQIAKLKGAGKVIGLASSSKHDRVKSLGADGAVDYNETGWAKNVKELIGESGIDIYLDSSGDLAGEGFDTLAYGGHWLIFGGQGAKGHPLDAARLGAIIGNNYTLRGYNLYFDRANFGRALTELIGWAAAGKLKIDVESFPLSQAAEVHRAIADRKTVGKVVLIP